MRALVVFESMFGNTQEIAEAVADGLGSCMDVDLVEVGAAPTVLGADVQVLVVGGPTHAFGMSRPGTRREAARDADRPLGSAGIGLREWLVEVEGASERVVAAAFDTHVGRPRLPGSAARAAHKRLRRMGFRMVTAPVDFYVTGRMGPLVPGEPDRARRWAADLATQLRPALTASTA